MGIRKVSIYRVHIGSLLQDCMIWIWGSGEDDRHEFLYCVHPGSFPLPLGQKECFGVAMVKGGLRLKNNRSTIHNVMVPSW